MPVPSPIKLLIDTIRSAILTIKNKLPTAVFVGSLLYNFFMRKLIRAEKETDLERTKRKWAENERDVEIEMGNKSDSDIIADAISEGEQFRQSRNQLPDRKSDSETKPKRDDNSNQ